MSEEENISTKLTSIVSTKRQRNILVIVLLLLTLAFGIGFNRYSNLKTKLMFSEQNIKALNDSVRVSENKVGELEYSKNILIAEKRDLEDLNADLAEEVKKEKGKVNEIIKLVSKIERDTTYLTNTLISYPNGENGLSWSNDTIYNQNNERHLSGISKFTIDSSGNIIPLETIITKDYFKFDLVTGLREKDGNIEIFVRSGFPGFENIQLDGAIIDPKNHPVMKKFTEPKRWGIGPYAGFGVNINTMPTANLGIGFSFGISIQYSLIRF